MFCCRFLTTIIVFISALASIAFLLAANIGTIGTQMVKSSIFLMELGMSDLDVSALVSNVGHVTYSELGFANGYLFGMYGYCRGTEGTVTQQSNNIWEDVNFSDATCTNSSASYTFNPITFVVDEINKHNTLGLTIDQSDITLPGGLENYVNTATRLSQVIYICSIIAICLTILAMLSHLFCCCMGSMIFVSFLQFLAFISAIISSAVATGAFKYIESEFNKYDSTFGIHAQLSRNYLILTWLGTGLSLVTVFAIMFSRCCFINPGPTPVQQFERVL